ncbi:MAG: hypothetical protein AB1Z98_21905 [Nannocystaceae bacterium]
MKNTDIWFGLIGSLAVLTACPGDDGSSETTNATNPTTAGMTTTATGTATDGETTGDPPATDTGGSDTTAGADSSTGEPVTCDPPCEANEDCIDGVCFPSNDCDPPCMGDEECVAGVCTAPPTGSDYGPCDMCAAGEMPVGIMGVEGCYCAPGCDGPGSMCPAPNEGTAMAVCALGTEPMMPTLCGLLCMSDDQCPTGATCTDVGGGSICMHPAP